MEMTIVEQTTFSSGLIRILLNGLALFALGYILSGVHFKSLVNALIAALILSVLNVTIAPVLRFFATPITLITFGLFSIVINAFLLWIVAYFMKGFELKNFGWAVILAVLVSIANTFLHSIYL